MADLTVLYDGIGALEDLIQGNRCGHDHVATTWEEVEDFFRIAAEGIYGEMDAEFGASMDLSVPPEPPPPPPRPDTHQSW